MAQDISQKKINEILWQACDTFRGTLDPTQYKDYILVMLFIKYLSDLWKDKQEQYRERYKETRGASSEPSVGSASPCQWFS